MDLSNETKSLTRSSKRTILTLPLNPPDEAWNWISRRTSRSPLLCAAMISYSVSFATFLDLIVLKYSTIVKISNWVVRPVYSRILIIFVKLISSWSVCSVLEKTAALDANFLHKKKFFSSTGVLQYSGTIVHVLVLKHYRSSIVLRALEQ